MISQVALIFLGLAIANKRILLTILLADIWKCDDVATKQKEDRASCQTITWAQDFNLKHSKMN